MISAGAGTAAGAGGSGVTTGGGGLAGGGVAGVTAGGGGACGLRGGVNPFKKCGIGVRVWHIVPPYGFGLFFAE